MGCYVHGHYITPLPEGKLIRGCEGSDQAAKDAGSHALLDTLLGSPTVVAKSPDVSGLDPQEAALFAWPILDTRR